MKKILPNENTQLKIIFAGTIFLLLITLIPLYVISHYNFMSMDDISYATVASQIWAESHSILQLFASIVTYCQDFWKEWAGIVTAQGLLILIMGPCLENSYYMSTYITLTCFVLSELFLFLVILIRLFHADFFRSAIISICVICLQVLLTPYPVEAFYWICGAVSYTCPYSEAMLLCAMLVLLYCYPQKRWKRVLLYIGVVLMTFMVSGGTYISLIGMLCIYFLTTAWFWYRKHPAKCFVTAGFILYLLGFFVNVLAPGNQVRLSLADTTGYSAFAAILRSLKEAAEYIAVYSVPACILLALLFLPLFANIVKKKDFAYPLPALVTFISFCVFAAQFTPTLYTLGITGMGRVQNIYRWTFYIWLYGNELYWVGWVLRRFEKKSVTQDRACFLLPGWFICIIGLFFILYLWEGNHVTTFSAIHDLYTGEAQTYSEEHLERMEILEDVTITDAVLEPFTSYPYLLYFADITTDPDYWANRSYAIYYGKNTVRLADE
ncbi:MAG: DUF6056 family protein [Lachnospiraceae bacterium]|nr:DUF6056 family protein [Lachnospiraceae bacterium]